MMVLAGSCLYGTMSSMVKMLHGKGYTAAEISYWQALIAALLGLAALATPPCCQQDEKERLVAPAADWQCHRSGQLSVLSVGAYIPASIAVIMLMQFMVQPIAGVADIRRKPSRIEFATMATILTGTLLAGGLMETDISTMSVKGLLTATGAAMAYAVYVVANGRMAKGEMAKQECNHNAGFQFNHSGH